MKKKDDKDKFRKFTVSLSPNVYKILMGMVETEGRTRSNAISYCIRKAPKNR